jgi:hypothetical protein
VDNGFIGLLLAHLMADPDLMHVAANRLKAYTLIDPIAHRTPAFIWKVMQECYGVCGKPPTYSFLHREIESRLKGSPDQLLLVEALETLGAMATVPKEDIRPEGGRFLLEEAMSGAAKVTCLEQFRRATTVKDLQKLTTTINGDLSSLGGRRSARMKPLMNMDSLLRAQNRLGFGVRFWDDNGGQFAPGEMHGLLGPTGGGKTVMAVAVACGQMKAKRHAMLFLYEQPLEGDISERICTNMTGIPIDNFRGKPLESLSEELRSKITFAQEECGQYLTVCDMLKEGCGAGGAGEIIRHIEENIEAGEKPALVIIDWFGAMVDRNHQFHPEVPADLRYRVLGTNILAELNAYATASKVSFLILHQLSTDATSRPPGHRPQKTDAAEMKSFSYKMHSCSALGTMRKDNNICWFVPDKSRGSSCQDTRVQLQGELMRFVDVRDQYKIVNNRFVPAEVEDAEALAENQKEDAYGLEL